MNQLPPDVLDALQRGQILEAVKRLRQSTGLGLKEAKDAIDARRPKGPAAFSGGMSSEGQIPSASPNGLSPGEMPRSGGSVAWVVGLALVACAGYFFFR